MCLNKKIKLCVVTGFFFHLGFTFLEADVEKGGVIFEEKNLGTCHVVLCSLYWTPNPKFHFDLLPFHLAQSLTVTGPQKFLPVSLKKAQTFLI